MNLSKLIGLPGSGNGMGITCTGIDVTYVWRSIMHSTKQLVSFRPTHSVAQTRK